MHILQALEALVDDILFVNVFQDVGADNSMQVSIHEVEHQIDVPVIFSANNVLEPDNILVPDQLLQENNLTECPLCVCRILEGVEIFLECYNLLGALVNGFPDNSIGTFS